MAGVSLATIHTCNMHAFAVPCLPRVYSPEKREEVVRVSCIETAVGPGVVAATSMREDDKSGTAVVDSRHGHGHGSEGEGG